MPQLGVRDRRGTLHQDGLLPCKNHPQSVFSHHLSPTAGTPKVHSEPRLLAGVWFLHKICPHHSSCRHKLLPSVIKIKSRHALQRDDLRTEGLQMLRKARV